MSLEEDPAKPPTAGELDPRTGPIEVGVTGAAVPPVGHRVSGKDSASGDSSSRRETSTDRSSTHRSSSEWPSSEWAAGVLAGGLSSRFVTDKARALWNGQPLLRHVLELASGFSRHATVLADRSDRYADFGLAALVDRRAAVGPLAGLEALLLHAQDHGLRGGLLLSCDTQGLQPQWLRALCHGLQPEDLACAYGDPELLDKAQGWQSLPVLVRVEALPIVQRALDGDQRALWRLLRELGARALPLPVDWHSAVVRVDQRSDLLRLPWRAETAAATTLVDVWRSSGDGWHSHQDCVSAEEPLEILVRAGPLGRRRVESAGVTMRTPGRDLALAAGWLLAAGVVSDPRDVLQMAVGQDGNSVRVDLRPGLAVPWQRLRRIFHATAACGVCGSAAVDHLLEAGRSLHAVEAAISWAALQGMPDQLRQRQTGFDQTGGVHAAALFALDGQLLDVAEDVGRHNAVDKVIGLAWLRYQLPLHQCVLVLSGRAGFELVQKALAAGVPIVAAVGAPSALAVDLADRAGQTLVGFLRPQRGNIYCGRQRIR